MSRGNLVTGSCHMKNKTRTTQYMDWYIFQLKFKMFSVHKTLKTQIKPLEFFFNFKDLCRYSVTILWWLWFTVTEKTTCPVYCKLTPSVTCSNCSSRIGLYSHKVTTAPTQTNPWHTDHCLQRQMGTKNLVCNTRILANQAKIISSNTLGQSV